MRAQQEELVRVGGTDVAVRIRLAGPDLLLCLHGLGCAKESFDSAFHTDFSSLKGLPDLTICAFDFPGHGHSRRLGEHTMSAYADITVGLVRRLAPRQLFLVCHSLGGAVGLIATQALGRIAGFINVEGNLVGEDCGLASRAVAAQAPTEFVRLGYSAFRARIERSTPAWAAWFALADPLALHQAARSLVEWSDSGKLLPMFTALPHKAYVYGARSRLDHLPLGEVPTYRIPAAGHFPMLDNPDALWRAVADIVTTR